MSTISRDLFDLFDNTWQKNYFKNENIKSADDKVLITLDMPGVDKENLKISLENDLLKIEGKIVDNGKVYSNSYVLSSVIDQETIVATIKNGVLIVEMNKKKTSKNITIK